MHELMRTMKLFVAVLLAAAMLVGCPRSLIPPQAPDTQGMEVVPALTGQVLFAAYTTQAEMAEVATSATVSLIESATNVTLSSSVTDANGIFSLNFGNGFKPDKSKAYFLEAVKGLSSGGDPNRAGASIARVRTLIYWRSGQWKSLTRQGVIVNRSTTAVSIIANLRAAASLPVNTEELIGSVNVGSPDQSVTPALPDTFFPAQSQISTSDFQRVHPMVSDALLRDTDPVFAVSMDVGPPLHFVQTTSGFEVSTLTPSSGLSHDLLTLTGYGFDPVPANNIVRFNGWAGTTESVSADRRSLKVRPPYRLGLSGATSLQIGSIVKVGPNWTQTGWHTPFDDMRDFKSLVNTKITGGKLVLDGANPLGFTDSTKADFDLGIRSGFAQVVADPLDGGDGAVTLQTNPLRVLQIFPDGFTQVAAAQGVYNYRPDLFDFETLPVTVYKTLITLDDVFTATKIDKSGTNPPATATVGAPVSRKLRDYDIMYFGVADSYGSHDLNDSAVALTRSFAQLGRGVVFTHDTLPASRPKFMELHDIHGMAPGPSTEFTPASPGSTVVYPAPGIDKTSAIMTRPFNLTGLDHINILKSHSSTHTTGNGATIWFAYDPRTHASASATPYWTTKTTATSNAAFFSYGHTPSTPAEYEAKAMINSMYYTYDRGTILTANFTSRAFDSTASGYAWKDTPFGWVARRATAGAMITFQVAATNSATETNLTYVGPDGTANTVFTTPGERIPALTGRYLRYRATLTTNSIAEVPLLSRVDIGSTFSTATSVSLAPNSLSAWQTASFATSPAGSLRIQVLDKDGNLIPDVILPGNSAGFASSPVDLSALPAHSYSALRLRLMVLKLDTQAPGVDSLSITWAP